MFNWKKKTREAVYVVGGYLMPVTGVILGIVFMVYHGGKFAKWGVPVVNDEGQIVKMDGPSEEYLVLFWLLTCLQMIFLMANIIGPCSVQTRAHTVSQFIGLCFNFIYLVTVNTALNEWPANATVSSPRLYFNLSATFQFTGSLILTVGAYRLSGLCQSTPKVQRRANPLEWPKIFKGGYTPVARPRHDSDSEGDEEELEGF